MKKLAEQIAPAIRPLIRQLLAVERSAAGVAAQFERLPVSHRDGGAEDLLEKVQQRIDKSFTHVTGTKPRQSYASPTEIRELLDLLDRFFAAFGIGVDTAELRDEFTIWVDDPDLWVAPEAFRRAARAQRWRGSFV